MSMIPDHHRFRIRFHITNVGFLINSVSTTMVIVLWMNKISNAMTKTIKNIRVDKICVRDSCGSMMDGSDGKYSSRLDID